MQITVKNKNCKVYKCNCRIKFGYVSPLKSKGKQQFL